jgi:chromodomain-helicase-DNA-binding protein 1
MMSTPALGDPLNGHLSPGDEISMSFDTGDHVTDSDSHDAPDHTLDHPSPISSDDANHDSNMIQDDTHMSASEQSSEDNASDDGDFDMEESILSQNEDVMEDRASSTDSNRTSKRKVPVEEEDYIKANPELYGLRRSVRCEKKKKKLHPASVFLLAD